MADVLEVDTKEPGEGLTDEQRRERGDFDAEDEGEDKAAKPDDDGEGGQPPAKVEADDDGDELKKAPKGVPYDRFVDMVKERDAEREARIRAEERAAMAAERPAAPAPKPVDLAKLRAEVFEKASTGDYEEAAKLQGEIDTEMDRQREERVLQRMTQVRDKEAIENAAEAMIEKYPFLDSSNVEERNKEAIQDVVDLRDVFINRGMSPAKALTKAAEKIGKQYAKVDDGEGEDGEPKARERQAIARNAAANLRQPPPASGGKGDRASKGTVVNIEKMSDAALKAIPEDQVKILRGDVV